MSTQLVSRSAELFGGKALGHTEQFSNQLDSVDYFVGNSLTKEEKLIIIQKLYKVF